MTKDRLWLVWAFGLEPRAVIAKGPTVAKRRYWEALDVGDLRTEVVELGSTLVIAGNGDNLGTLGGLVPPALLRALQALRGGRVLTND